MQQKSAQTRQSKNQGPFILNEAMPDLLVAFLGWSTNFEKKSAWGLLLGILSRFFCPISKTSPPHRQN